MELKVVDPEGRCLSGKVKLLLGLHLFSSRSDMFGLRARTWKL